jgi:predicted cupin superfamily sugar epimerase
MTAEEIIRRLRLQPHPKERGYFVETYRSEETIGSRSLSTAIYFLLKQDSFSEMHRLRSDELFHFYCGSAAEALLLDASGQGKLVRLGNDFAKEEQPQLIIPKGCWQGMRSTGEFTLLGCTVAPGFDYSDYESGNRSQLIARYPEWTEWIVRLTEEPA